MLPTFCCTFVYFYIILKYIERYFGSLNQVGVARHSLVVPNFLLANRCHMMQMICDHPQIKNRLYGFLRDFSGYLSSLCLTKRLH